MPESKEKPRRLGRGLSALLGAAPVAVEVTQAVDVQEVKDTPKADATLSDVVSGDGLTQIAVASIVVSPYQPRRVMDEGSIDRLAESIRRQGVMQPVIVRPVPGSSGRFELVAGERRWRAARKAGLERLPAIVRDLSEDQAAEWALVENVQREDLNAMERAFALRALSERFSLTQAEVAQRVALDRSSVANLIRLTELEPEIADRVASGELSGGHGKALLALPAGPARVQLASHAAAFGWSVRRLENEVKDALAAKPSVVGASSGGGPASSRAAVLQDLERQLSQRLGTKVSIQADRGGTKGRVMIAFYGLDHFDGLMQRLGVTPSA